MSTIIGLILAVVLHEAAHCLVTISRGLKVKRVVLNWRGIGVQRERGTELDTLLIAMAGPMANLALAIVGVMIASPSFLTVNVIFCVVNLLPIPGSDGIKAVRALWAVAKG